MLPVALLHLLDDRRDRRGVDIGSFHQSRGSVDVVGVDGLEEVVDGADSRQLFQDERALEIIVIHRSRPLRLAAYWSAVATGVVRRQKVDPAVLAVDPHVRSPDHTSVQWRGREGARYRTA